VGPRSRFAERLNLIPGLTRQDRLVLGLDQLVSVTNQSGDSRVRQDASHGALVPPAPASGWNVFGVQSPCNLKLSHSGE
jgi:hypothetical protein